MEQENKSIHEFDFQLICNFYKALHRQGPGSPEATAKAVSFIENLPENAKIADLGCGTGGQTLELAKNVNGNITGLDLFPDFINTFNSAARKHGLENRMKGVVGSMDDLPFAENELDLIWSEGAIYNIGFENGLKLWNKYLKTGGYIAVSEVSWFTPARLAEIEDFWMDAYPEIATIPVKVAQMQEAGYVPVAHFILPENCWTENFYEPMPPVEESFLNENAGNKLAYEFIENQRHERKLYYKYKDYYGYVFYIGKKI